MTFTVERISRLIVLASLVAAGAAHAFFTSQTLAAAPWVAAVAFAIFIACMFLICIPLAAYYSVTLALPLANGAAAFGAAFVRHALVVLAVPPILIVAACGLCAAANSGCSRIQRPAQQSSS